MIEHKIDLLQYQKLDAKRWFCYLKLFLVAAREKQYNHKKAYETLIFTNNNATILTLFCTIIV